ncbi:hypothetical protein HYY75_00370 [bacterium]|nr:hypothetical protein [bacterium]
MKALSERYDGDPNIAFFWFEESACGYPRAEEEWIKAGFTDLGIYKDALMNRCRLFKKYFKKTPLMQMINKFRKSDKDWFEKHPEDFKGMWDFAEFLVQEGVYLGTPDFYESEEKANNHDKTLIWPIFKKFSDKAKIVVFIDEPHSKKIKDPLSAINNLFSSYPVDHIFLFPALVHDSNWRKALEIAKKRLRP